MRPAFDALMKASLILGLIAAAGAASAQAGGLIVRAEGIRSNQGRVYVGVCEKSFERKDCPLGSDRPARTGAMEFRFDAVKPGLYAIAVYHDEDGDGDLDKNFIGVPTEPYAFSNDAGRTTPPTFGGAAVNVGAQGARITVQVRPGFAGR